MIGSTGIVALRGFLRVALLAAASLLLVMTANAPASAETRTLKLYHVHLRERTEITYKRNGRFLADGLKKANWALRDWRESKPTNMDPLLLDLLWEAHRQSGSRDYIHIIGGYRSPKTNSGLRSRSSGVAETSLHMSGKAVDFFIPDVPLRRLRDIGLRMQVGGVGYYPRSGSPFVHYDTGRGRHWPRLSRKELAGVFPNGNTIHVPSDGRPLPGYETAMASYNSRRGAAGNVQIASGSGERGRGRTLLAAIFGGGAEEADDNAAAAVAPAPAQRQRQAAPQPPVQVAAARPQPPAALASGVPMPGRDAIQSQRGVPTPPSEVPGNRQIAALDLSRIPMPTSAPVRGPAQVAVAAASVVTAGTAPAVPETAAPAQNTVESSLVAALEAPAPSAATAGQLAYAVPMPSRRPPFEAILDGSAAAPADPAAAELAQAVAAIVPEPTPDAPTEAPQPRFVAHPSARPSDIEPTAAPVAVAALAPDAVELRPAIAPAPRPEPIAAASAPAAEIPTGRSGRVVPAGTASRAVPTVPAPTQEAIASRIEVASVVTAPEPGDATGQPKPSSAAMLVVNVPVSTVANAFAPRAAHSPSDRFTGSAISLQTPR